MKVINLDKKIFERAFSLCYKAYEHAEIFDVLSKDDDVEKQIAILKLSDVKNKTEAESLVSHLTGQDGPIREAVAIKLKELILDKRLTVLDDKDFYKIYVDGICDVNPNICRFVIEFLPVLTCQNYLKKLILEKIEQVFSRIENPDIAQKNFKTVRVFNLYWLFESIGNLLSKDKNFEYEERLCELLEKATAFNDYTIDEKIARILAVNIEAENYKRVLRSISNINNFYVSRYFEDKFN